MGFAMTFFKVTLACLLAIGIINLASALVELSLRSNVYACSTDKDILPDDAALQCKRLTKGQWWHK
jgi:hypothetical protein